MSIPPPGALRGFGAELTAEGPGRWRVPGNRGGQLEKSQIGTGFRQFRHRLAPGDGGDGDHAHYRGVHRRCLSCAPAPWRGCVDPLKAFGLTYEGQGPKALMPLTLHGAKAAVAQDVTVKTASAQVKSALLLAALNAAGQSRYRQGVLTRDHTREDAGGLRRATSKSRRLPNGGEIILIEGPAKLSGCTVEVPRDPSSRRLRHCGGPDRAGLRDRTARHPAQSPPHRPDRDPAGDGREDRSAQPP